MNGFPPTSEPVTSEVLTFLNSFVGKVICERTRTEMAEGLLAITAKHQIEFTLEAARAYAEMLTPIYHQCRC